MLIPVPLEQPTRAGWQDPPVGRSASLEVQQLRSGEEPEVLAFLEAQPLHTVVMAGFIRDHGLVSPFNRGDFYGYRNGQGRLEGVGLIGHATLFETRTEEALLALARLAQTFGSAHVLMGEWKKIERFWLHYSGGGQVPRRVCRELLLEHKGPVRLSDKVSGLRKATPDDLALAMPVQAQMALAESGINPMEVDPEGFRQRCQRRIERNRTWVAVANGRLKFKADVMAETPQVIYLEGVYVSPDMRDSGYGLACLSQLTRDLLTLAGSICLLVNEENLKARIFYFRAGYKLCSYYDTIFLQQ